MSAGAFNVTLPEMEHVGVLMARLYPKRAEFDPRGSASGASRWGRQDGQTIAAAIGLYAQGKPRRRFPAMLLMARCWQAGLTPPQKALMIATTMSVLSRRKPKQMPKRARAVVTGVMDSGALAMLLLDEFCTPSPCWKCQGHGEILTGRLVVTCTQCNGFAEGPRGTPTRAAGIGVTRSMWCTYLQQPYERTLHGYRFMADHAAHGVLAKMA